MIALQKGFADKTGAAAWRPKKSQAKRIFLLHGGADLVFCKGQLASLALVIEQGAVKGSHATASVA